MRVLLVSNTLPPLDISGVGEQVMQLATGLRSHGHEVRVLGRGPDGARGPKVLFPLACVPPCWHALREFRPHIVQVHESDGALAALVTKVVQGVIQPSPRIVALLQVSYLEELKAVRAIRDEGDVVGRPGLKERGFKWLKAPLQIVLGWLTVWLADSVLAPSRRTARELERDYQIGSVEVLPNVTGGGFVATNAVSAKTDDELLLFVGRLRIRKAVETLLISFKHLLVERPQIRLLIAGEGEHRDRLQATVRELDLVHQVDFLGRCDAGRVHSLMSSAKALVVSSIYEGMPLVILEAMHCGLPVVASAVSGIPEVVLDGERGWLVPAEDSAALSDALRQVVADPNEAARRAKAAREWVEQEANPESAALRWLNLMVDRSHQNDEELEYFDQG